MQISDESVRRFLLVFLAFGEIVRECLTMKSPHGEMIHSEMIATARMSQ